MFSITMTFLIKVDLKKSHIKQHLTCTADGTLIYITFKNYDDFEIDLILRTMDFKDS